MSVAEEVERPRRRGRSPSELPDGLQSLARGSIEQARPVETIVVDVLRKAILTGVLPTGQKLRQARLAGMLGVSKIPVRVALRQLESEGLVSHTPRLGFVVSRMSPQDIAEVYEILANLEAWAVELALPKLDRAHFKRLHDLNRQIAHEHDPRRLLELRERFYDELFGAAGQHRLSRLISQMRAEVSRYLLARQLPPTHGDHGDLLEILESGNAKKAAAHLRNHLVEVGERLRQTAEQADLEVEPAPGGMIAL